MAQKDFYFLGVDKDDAMASDGYWDDSIAGDYDQCYDEAYRRVRENDEDVNVYVAWFYEGELPEFFAEGTFPPGFANRMRVDESNDWLRKEIADQQTFAAHTYGF